MLSSNIKSGFAVLLLILIIFNPFVNAQKTSLKPYGNLSQA